MANVGDILNEPENGWVRYKVSEAVEDNKHNYLLGDSGFQISLVCLNKEKTYSNSIFNYDNFDKIPLGTKIRIIGKNTNTKVASTTQTKNSFWINIGYPWTGGKILLEKECDIFNENTLIFEFEITEEIINHDEKYLNFNNDASFESSIFAIDIQKYIPTFNLTSNKNKVHFDLINFKDNEKYSIFSIQNNSLIKIFEAETKEFDLTLKYDTEYNFCICKIENGTSGELSEINKIKTEVEIIIMPYGKTNNWKLNKNLQDEINNFDFVSTNKKFEKFNHEYFLSSKNKSLTVCNKKFADYYSFGLKFNFVLLQSGDLSKIISNCSDDLIYGWALMNTKDEIFLKYNNYKTKNIKIKTNKKIELIIEFNNNNYINFFINKELVLTTKKINDIIYNKDCFIKIGDSSESNFSFLINNVVLYNGIINDDLIVNPTILSLINKKNKNIITFSDIPEASFYKVLRSENKFGKYQEIGIVEKTDE